MKYFIFFFILFVFSCSKDKSILICGDHKCINNTEAKQFFEENLTIEIQIINKDKKSSFDLIDLNVNESKPNIKILKSKNNKVVKKLSKEEIKEKKIEIKEKISKSKKKTKKVKNKELAKKNTKKNIPLIDTADNSIDICLKLEKCDIDSITSYLIKQSKNKDFPNISLRE